MARQITFEGSNDIGVFCRLTNTYCLCGLGASQAFYSSLQWMLGDSMPIARCFIGGCRVVGRLCVGNKHGLLVPESTGDQELQHLTNALPDEVKIQRIEERLSALGNVIACNDHVALVHPDLDKKTEEILQDTLNVEVFRGMVADNVLVGTYCVFTNQGGVVHPRTSVEQLDELATLLQVPLVAATVNRGSNVLGAGLTCNDWFGLCGFDTTSFEIDVINNIMKYSYTDHWDDITRKNVVETLT
ncbi:hypothetical protein GJ496_005186 [Pomphorhynchus laevis]|nr:hypothetical protein GJ496_005186 [Pomphorhynchus laevis]